MRGTVLPFLKQAYVLGASLFMANMAGLTVNEGRRAKRVFCAWCTRLSIIIITTVKRYCQAESEHL